VPRFAFWAIAAQAENFPLTSAASTGMMVLKRTEVGHHVQTIDFAQRCRVVCMQ
jgi:hypothetical protein